MAARGHGEANRKRHSCVFHLGIDCIQVQDIETGDSVGNDDVTQAISEQIGHNLPFGARRDRLLSVANPVNTRSADPRLPPHSLTTSALSLLCSSGRRASRCKFALFIEFFARIKRKQ
jgi:hypothetical protein